MKILLRILINAIAIGVMLALLPERFDSSGGIAGIFVVAVVFGLVNAFIRPIVRLFSLPITCLTLGLFTLVINTLMLLLTAWLSGGFLSINGGPLERFLWGFIGAIIISIVSGVLSWFLPDDTK
jgi:putative membrane protein